MSCSFQSDAPMDVVCVRTTSLSSFAFFHRAEPSAPELLEFFQEDKEARLAARQRPTYTLNAWSGEAEMEELQLSNSD